jgi:hypothetical protein
VTCFDRNFPGYDLIIAILLAKGHVIARVKAGIALPFDGGPGRGWLPDGSRVSWLNAPSGKKEDRLPVRVTEHSALVAGPDGQEVSETCTLLTTFLVSTTASRPLNVTSAPCGLVSSIETHPADQRFLRHRAFGPLVSALPLLSHCDYRAGRSLRAGPPAR